MNKPEKIKEWTKKIADFNQSGKNKQEWCEENNISAQQLAYWYGRVSKNQTAQWLPVEIQCDNTTYNMQEKTPINQLNAKVKIASIEIPQNIDKEILLDILKTLKSL